VRECGAARYLGDGGGVMRALRRLLNRIDRWLDRRSLASAQAGEERLPGGGVPCLASHALERAMVVARRLDGDVRLKSIAAPQGTASDGAARRWSLRLELPGRRAKLRCDWYLDGDTRFGRFGRECMDWAASPFPAADSVLARGVEEGRLRHCALAVAWRQERRHAIDLPLVFRDSDVALVDLQAHGLDPAATGYTLRSQVEPTQGPVWVAQGPSGSVRCRFA
jgi:hypothetical protein